MNPYRPYVRIPREEIGAKQKVHVEGWKHGCVFRFQGWDEDGGALLVTPKTGRKFKTRNPLCYVRREEPIDRRKGL